MTDRSHRLTILTQEEIDELYAQPRFNDKDRDLYFELNNQELAVATERRGAAGVYFVLLLGYFRAKHQFFEVASDSTANDVKYIVGRYFPDVRERFLTPPSRPTLQSLQDQILDLLGYRRWAGMRDTLAERLNELATRSTQPRYLFREALQFLDRERIVRPAYTHLQDIVGEVMNHERDRLTALLNQALTPDMRQQLNALLKADGSIYRISLLKQDLRDFSYKALTKRFRGARRSRRYTNSHRSF